MTARRHVSRIAFIVSFAIGTLPMVCQAQEVGSIDLTNVTAHTRLRRPTPKDGESSVRRGGILHETQDCGPSTKNVGSGKERSGAEWKKLLRGADFECRGIMPVAGELVSIIEAGAA